MITLTILHFDKKSRKSALKSRSFVDYKRSYSNINEMEALSRSDCNSRGKLYRTESTVKGFKRTVNRI